MWYTLLFSCVQHDLTFETLQNGHHNKSSYHLSAYKVNAILLTVFSMLYFSSPWLTYYATGCLHLFIPFTYSTPHLPPIFTVSHLWQPPECFLYLRVWVLFLFQSPHVNGIVWYLSFSVRLSSFSMILLSSTHVVAHDDITFFFWLRSILLCLLSTPPSVDTEDVSICSVQSLSCVRLFATPWTAARQASLSITNSGNLLKLMSVELVMPSSPLILYHPFLLPPSFFPSIRVFFNESVIHIRWPKYWSFSFSISPSSEYSGLPLGWTGLILQSKGLSRVFSNTTVRRHQFFGAQLCLYYNSHIHIWLLEEPWLWLDEPLLAK